MSPVPQSSHLGCWGDYPQVSSASRRGSGCLPRPSVQLGALKAVATRATPLRQCRLARDCIHLAAACSSLWRKLFSLPASRCSAGWRNSGLRSSSLPSRPPGYLSPLSNGSARGSITAHRGQANPARRAPPRSGGESTGMAEASSLAGQRLGDRKIGPNAQTSTLENAPPSLPFRAGNKCALGACGVRKPIRHAATAYSWMSPPRRSRRWT